MQFQSTKEITQRPEVALTESVGRTKYLLCFLVSVYVKTCTMYENIQHAHATLQSQNTDVCLLSLVFCVISKLERF